MSSLLRHFWTFLVFIQLCSASPAYLLRCVRKAIIWFLSVVEDSDQVVFHDRNKVDLQIVWPTEGIFVRLSGGTVSSPNSQGMRFGTPGVRHNEGQSDTAFTVLFGPQTCPRYPWISLYQHIYPHNIPMISPYCMPICLVFNIPLTNMNYILDHTSLPTPNCCNYLPAFSLCSLIFFFSTTYQQNFTTILPSTWGVIGSIWKTNWMGCWIQILCLWVYKVGAATPGYCQPKKHEEGGTSQKENPPTPEPS